MGLGDAREGRQSGFQAHQQDIYSNGTKASCAQVWGFAPSINAAKPVISHTLNGICRILITGDDNFVDVVRSLELARQACNQPKLYGKDFYAKKSTVKNFDWRPFALRVLAGGHHVHP